MNIKQTRITQLNLSELQYQGKKWKLDANETKDLNTQRDSLSKTEKAKKVDPKPKPDVVAVRCTVGAESNEGWMKLSESNLILINITEPKWNHKRTTISGQRTWG